MFIIALTYIRPIADIEANLQAHRQFLDKYYAAGTFLLSGRKEPRNGGIIIAKAGSLAEVQKIVQEDPFHQANVAEYEITEFLPSKTAADLVQYREL